MRKVELSDVVQKNIEKVSFRYNRENPTRLHDQGEQVLEQLPRRFEISFVTIAPGRARMYLDGQKLGNDLTDNSYNDDGYRFHDVMHLANAAKLAWSPVLRSLMGRKRKSNPKTDEVEDGARAKIVEEAIIKAVHSEGVRLAGKTEDCAKSGLVRLFPRRSDITFRFLKFINSFVAGLESQKNRFWEWEDAIFEGYAIFDQLRHEGQGTVIVDLEKRSITFDARVCIDIRGKVAGLGSAYVGAAVDRDERLKLLVEQTCLKSGSNTDVTRAMAQKLAILDALGIQAPSVEHFDALQLTEVTGRGISIKAAGIVQRALWDRHILSIRTTTTTDSTQGCCCTAVAIADD